MTRGDMFMTTIVCVMLISIMITYETSIRKTKTNIDLQNDTSIIPNTINKCDQTLVSAVPSQFILPTQTNNYPKNDCKDETDWFNKFKCPGHHPYQYSQVRTIQRISSKNGKYGKVSCVTDIICTNVYDADSIGLVYFK